MGNIFADLKKISKSKHAKNKKLVGTVGTVVEVYGLIFPTGLPDLEGDELDLFVEQECPGVLGGLNKSLTPEENLEILADVKSLAKEAVRIDKIKSGEWVDLVGKTLKLWIPESKNLAEHLVAVRIISVAITKGFARMGLLEGIKLEAKDRDEYIETIELSIQFTPRDRRAFLNVMCDSHDPEIQCFFLEGTVLGIY